MGRWLFWHCYISPGRIKNATIRSTCESASVQEVNVNTEVYSYHLLLAFLTGLPRTHHGLTESPPSYAPGSPQSSLAAPPPQPNSNSPQNESEGLAVSPRTPAQGTARVPSPLPLRRTPTVRRGTGHFRPVHMNSSDDFKHFKTSKKQGTY